MKILNVILFILLFLCLDCLANKGVKVEIIRQRIVENNTHNYLYNREIQIRVTNQSKSPLFIRGRKTDEFFPIGFFVGYNSAEKKWESPFDGDLIPEFKKLDISEFDNYRLLPNESFTFTDLLMNSEVKIKYKRVIYVSFESEDSITEIRESPIFLLKRF